MGSDCQICAKHRGEGPLGGELVTRIDGFWIYHAPAGKDGLASLGHLLIESDRHAPYLDNLNKTEAGGPGLHLRPNRPRRDGRQCPRPAGAAAGPGPDRAVRPGRHVTSEED